MFRYFAWTLQPYNFDFIRHIVSLTNYKETSAKEDNCLTAFTILSLWLKQHLFFSGIYRNKEVSVEGSKYSVVSVTKRVYDFLIVMSQWVNKEFELQQTNLYSCKKRGGSRQEI